MLAAADTMATTMVMSAVNHTSRRNASAGDAPISNATPGIAGKIYGMSLESDREKKMQMKTIQIHRNDPGSKSPRGARRRQLVATTRNADSVQGILPNTSTAAKNHQTSWRSALGVK